MKKIVLYILVLFYFVGLGVLQVSAKSATAIKVTCEEWAGYTNKDGTGLYWELVKTVFDLPGYNVNLITAPWKRAEVDVKNGKMDILVGDYFYPEKEGIERIYPSWHLSIEDDIVIMFQKDIFPDWDINGKQVLANMRVAWIRGYDFDKGLLNKISIRIHELTKIEHGIKMLNRSRVDAIIDYSSNLLKEVENNNLDLDKFRIETLVKGNKLFLVFANTEAGKKFANIYDERMDILVKKGEIQKIFKKWGYENKFGPDLYEKR